MALPARHPAKSLSTINGEDFSESLLDRVAESSVEQITETFSKQANTPVDGSIIRPEHTYLTEKSPETLASSAALRGFFEKQTITFNTVTRMLAMALTFPLLSVSANSAARGLPVPRANLMSFKGVLPAMVIAGVDMLAMLLTSHFIKKGVSELSMRSHSKNPALGAAHPDFKCTELCSSSGKAGANRNLTQKTDVKLAARLLLESFAIVLPCSLATTSMGNYFDKHPQLMDGLRRTIINNLGFLTALEVSADKKPGDNRARLATALLCAFAVGMNNGAALGRKIPVSNVTAYALSSALATMWFQAVFEAVRYPIHGKNYRSAGTPPVTE